MNFSIRTAWELEENDFAAALRTARDTGQEPIDLTVSNPTVCGFTYRDAELLAPLSSASALHYVPDPLGMVSARQGVAKYYRDHDAEVSLDRICLTTSTSEAYSFLFRLLCDSGDEVLIARPSYPLFDYIARLDEVRLQEYPLLYDPHHGWMIDLHSLEARITPRTRAVIVVHPNNPTGNFVSAAEREKLEEICLRHGMALIVDEVFLDYALDGVIAQSFTTGSPQVLTFVLSGLSKICGLPQMKASWIAACGPEPTVGEAMARLEVIADTYLSMNAPIQSALPPWLENRHGLQQQIRERMTANLAALETRLSGSSAQRLEMQGGWTVVLRVPRSVEGKPFAFAALDRGALVQPGDFYGLPEGRAVLSLLTPPEQWQLGLARLPLEDLRA